MSWGTTGFLCQSKVLLAAQKRKESHKSSLLYMICHSVHPTLCYFSEMRFPVLWTTESFLSDFSIFYCRVCAYFPKDTEKISISLNAICKTQLGHLQLILLFSYKPPSHCLLYRHIWFIFHYSNECLKNQKCKGCGGERKGDISSSLAEGR